MRDTIIRERKDNFPLVNDKVPEYDNMSDATKKKVRQLTKEALIVAVAIEGIDHRRCRIKHHLQHAAAMGPVNAPRTIADLSQLSNVSAKTKNKLKKKIRKRKTRTSQTKWHHLTRLVPVRKS